MQLRAVLTLACAPNGETDVRLGREELEGVTRALAYFVRDYRKEPPPECAGARFAHAHNVALHFRAILDNQTAPRAYGRK